MAKETTVGKPVSAASKEDLVTIVVDRRRTDGGIRINDIKYVGEVTVSKEIAGELMRIQDEYAETKEKLNDKSVHVRHKSSLTIEKLFLADPQQHGDNKSFSRDLGLLHPLDWSYCPQAFKDYLLKQRKALYGY